jgi:hypothetical protein
MSFNILILVGAFALTGLFVYALLRYGSVSREYVKIEKDEVKKLKAEHKRYKQSKLPSKPEGKPLYKKRMVSHEGLAIFNNGIYAKFMIGKKGKYRFVPFTDVSDIYPAKMENPFTKSDSVLMGLKSWKEMQIETVDGMVHVVDSRKHDFSTITPTLKGAMGGRWDSVYHADEVLWSNIREGDVWIHKSIRMQRPGYIPPKVKETIEKEEPRPKATGKGALLLQESEADLAARRSSFKKASSAIILIGALTLVGGWYVLSSGFFIIGFFSLMLFLIGILLMVVGAVILATSGKLAPLRIYENGFEAPLLLPGKQVFISYGEITGTRTRKTFIEGEVYLYETGVPNQTIVIKKNMMGFENVKDLIRSKIGRAEHIVELEPTEEERTTSRRIEYSLYAIGVTLGIGASVLVALNIYSGMSMRSHLLGLGVLLPIVTMMSLTFLVFSMRRMERVVPKKLNVKIPAAVIVIMLVIGISTLGFGFVTEPYVEYDSRELIEPRPSTTGITPGDYENLNVILNDHILVESGESLTLRNSTITMDMSFDKELSIWIAEGGELVLENTTIESNSQDYGYTFEIMGSARIIGSEIIGVWGDPEYENDNGGLEIYSDDVIVDGSTVKYTNSNGILIKNSSPLIINSTIIHVIDDGIEMRNSTASVINNTIRDTGWAMIIGFGSEPLVLSNDILYNDHGIWVGVSDPVIEGNNFSYNEQYAIMCDEYSQPIVKDNVFVGNENDLIEEEPSPLLEMCFILIVGEAVVCLLVLFWVYKEGMDKEKKRKPRAFQ